MDLNGYTEKYGVEATRKLCEKVGSTWSYFRRVLRGDASFGRCRALHVEKESRGIVTFEELMRRPTKEEYQRYLQSRRGSGNRGNEA